MAMRRPEPSIWPSGAEGPLMELIVGGGDERSSQMSVGTSVAGNFINLLLAHFFFFVNLGSVS